MRKFWFPGLVGLLLLILAACGSSATAVPAAKQAPVAPAAAAQPAAPAAAQPAAPAAAAQPAAPAAAAQPAAPAAKAAPRAVTLADAAAKLAGKPGAVYIGDFKQLVGPAPTKELGDADGNVRLSVLEKDKYVFQTDYYKSLIEKAKLTNPTQLVTSGQNFKLQYVCINRALDPCKLIEAYLAPNVLKRTNGQVEITISSYPELGIDGRDMLDLLKDGSVDFGQVQPAQVGGTLPIIDIIYLWGLWSDRLAEHTANTKAVPTLDTKVSEKAGGGKVVFHVWYGGNDLYFFSKKPLRTPDDFKGVKIRSHGTTMSDYINALGGEAQFVAFAETYTAVERGILGATNSGGKAGYGQRWYEVTKYLSGPIISLPMGYETMNKGKWDRFPADIQQILIEEGAKQELENLRLSPEWLDSAVSLNVAKGMVVQPFSDEFIKYVYENVTLGRIVPSWIKRSGGPGSEAVKLYNDIYAPLSGVKIEADGSLVKVGGQKVPAAPAAAAAAAQTKLTSKGKWDLQLAWISRTTDGFKLTEEWVKRISDRTNGAINISLVSYPELGIGGTDTLQQMKDGTIPFLELFSGYIGGDLPFADMNSLFGLYDNSEVQLKAMDAVKEDMAREIDKHNGVIISYGYYPDFYIYSKKPLTKVADFKNLKIRAHTPALADLAAGLGAQGLWLAFTEMYAALERGVFQAGVTVTDAGYGQRWYEVTDYLYGPIVGYPQTWVTMNKDVWKKLPPDVQAILLEEGQWREQQARRNTIRDTEKNLKLNTDAGLKYSDFSPEVKAVLQDTAVNVVLPNWVKKVGGPNSEAVKIFNQKISPILGVKVNPDGTASRVTPK